MDWCKSDVGLFSDRIPSPVASLEDIVLKDGNLDLDSIPSVPVRNILDGTSGGDVDFSSRRKFASSSKTNDLDCLLPKPDTIGNLSSPDKLSSPDELAESMRLLRDVQKFVVSQSRGIEKDAARAQLALDLGAKMPKAKFLNYKDYKSRKSVERRERVAEKARRDQELSNVKKKQKRRDRRKK